MLKIPWDENGSGLTVFVKEQIELIKTKIERWLNGIPLQLTLTLEQLFYFLGK